MDFNHIENKKPFYPIKNLLLEHLEDYSRVLPLPITYDDLTNYRELMSVVDKNGEDTLWYAALYLPSDLEQLHQQLVTVYEMLVADGYKIPYLKIGSIEFCSFGNSKPFRIKVVNEINDNHDYFYVKRADASRIYGLELEEVFSPDKVSFLINGETLIEEHIVGVPCDDFILDNKHIQIVNRTRFAKEFVKFNERCFVRLLGDMRAYNFVVEITQDFDNVQYRLRAIDFDQQSYEGRKSIYLPQYYKGNRALVNLASELLTSDVADQYMKEERAAMRKRYISRKKRTKSLLMAMKNDQISTEENVRQLRKDLNQYYNHHHFTDDFNMGDILAKHLELKLNINIFEDNREMHISD
tara:strand:+ start:36497 stop:37558 length:1062 start_codon:yes stop_codon:yes gene_type:complete